MVELNRSGLILAGYSAFILSSLIVLGLACWPEQPEKLSGTPSQTRMLERCADLLAIAMDKQGSVDHSMPEELLAFPQLHSSDESAAKKSGSAGYQPASNIPGKLKSKEVRTLIFPADASFAELLIGLPDSSGLAATWSKFGTACGKVAVPKDQCVRLLIYPGASNIKAVQLLKPDDIQALDASRTPLINDDLKELSRLTGLKSLNLSNCKIDDAGLPSLKALKQLTLLDLGKTDVSDKVFEIAAGLPHLDYLVLSKCKRITGVGISNLRRIYCLILDETALSRQGLINLGRLDVVQVHMDGVKINDDEFESYFKISKHLQILSAPNTRLSGTQLNWLPTLISLNLAGCPVSDETISGIKRHKLIWLYLGKTSLTDSGLEAVLTQTSLKDLDLSGTKISDQGAARLSRLGDLTRLVLPEQVSSDTVSKLKRQLPNCKIVQRYF